MLIRSRPWTREELQEFIRLYPSTENGTLMKLFNRTARAVQCKARSLRVFKTEAYRTKHGCEAHKNHVGPRRPRMVLRLPRETRDQLLAEYPNEPNFDIARRYGMSVRAVTCLANRLKVFKSQQYRSTVGRQVALKNIRRMAA